MNKIDLNNLGNAENELQLWKTYLFTALMTAEKEKLTKGDKALLEILAHDNQVQDMIQELTIEN